MRLGGDRTRTNARGCACAMAMACALRSRRVCVSRVMMQRAGVVTRTHRTSFIVATNTASATFSRQQALHLETRSDGRGARLVSVARPKPLLRRARALLVPRRLASFAIVCSIQAPGVAPIRQARRGYLRRPLSSSRPTAASSHERFKRLNDDSKTKAARARAVHCERLFAAVASWGDTPPSAGQ